MNNYNSPEEFKVENKLNKPNVFNLGYLRKVATFLNRRFGKNNWAYAGSAAMYIHGRNKQPNQRNFRNISKNIDVTVKSDPFYLTPSYKWGLATVVNTKGSNNNNTMSYEVKPTLLSNLHINVFKNRTEKGGNLTTKQKLLNGLPVMPLNYLIRGKSRQVNNVRSNKVNNREVSRMEGDLQRLIELNTNTKTNTREKKRKRNMS